MFLRLGSQRVKFTEVTKGGKRNSRQRYSVTTVAKSIAIIGYPVAVHTVVPKIVGDETNTLPANLQPCQIPTLLDMPE